MFCPHCGKEIENDTKICMNCGCPVAPDKTTKTKNSNGCLIGCIVTFLILSVLGFIFFMILGVIGLHATNEAINQTTGENSSALYKILETSKNK